MPIQFALRHLLRSSVQISNLVSILRPTYSENGCKLLKKKRNFFLSPDFFFGKDATFS